MPTTSSSFSPSGWVFYSGVTVGPTRTIVLGQEVDTDGGNMPSISVVDGEIIIRNPSTFKSVPHLCPSYRCPRRNECLRNIGNRDALGIPTKENTFVHDENGCAYFIPRIPEHINQLRERGVNGLRSAWHM